MIPLRESPRWLAIKGRHEEALNNLAYIRLDDAVGPETRDEYNEIRDNIGALEMEAGGVRLKELWIPRNRKRVLIGLTLMVSQQLTGTTVFTYVRITWCHSILLGVANHIFSFFFLRCSMPQYSLFK